MTNEQKQVKDMMQKYLQDTPEKPEIPSLEVRKRCAKLILEEALETIEALGFEIDFQYKDPNEWDQINPNLTLIADGCEDLKVVTEGCLVACGLTVSLKSGLNELTNEFKLRARNEDPLFKEVMRSNMTKLWDEDDLELLTLEEGSKEGFYKDTPVTVEEVGLDSVGGYLYLVKDPSGKFIKSPSYSPANLEPIIEEMKK